MRLPLPHLTLSARLADAVRFRGRATSRPNPMSSTARRTPAARRLQPRRQDLYLADARRPSLRRLPPARPQDRQPAGKQGWGPLAVSPDGKHLAMQGWDGMVRVLGKPRHRQDRLQRARQGQTTPSTSFAADAKYLSNGSARSPGDIGVENNIHVIAVDGWKIRHHPQHYYLYSLAVSPDGRIAAGPGGVLPEHLLRRQGPP